MSAALETQVNEMLPCEQLSEYWKHGFYITSMATVGAHWAIVLSTNAGFEDQYVKVFKTAHPYKSTAIGRKGWFTYDGDSDGKAPDLACLGACILRGLLYL